MRLIKFQEEYTDKHFCYNAQMSVDLLYVAGEALSQI